MKIIFKNILHKKGYFEYLQKRGISKNSERGAKMSVIDMGMEINQLTRKIIGAAIEVHKIIGPGLLESIYEECLCYELHLQGINFECQKTIPLIYKGHNLNCDYRLDVLVEDKVILELKSVEELCPIHEAQLITYLRLTDKSIGLIINFNVDILKNGIKRIVNKL